jgi:tol-pal system protein YbgF
MIDRSPRILAAAVCILLVSGCYARRLHDVEARLDSHDWRLATLRDSIEAVSADVAHLDSVAGDQSVPMRTTGARMESRMDELETRLEMLESTVKDTRYRVSQMSVRRPSGASDSMAAEPDTSTVIPSIAQSIYESAYMDFAKGDFESAIGGFRDFVTRFPVNDFSDDAQLMIGQSYMGRGDYPGAITELRKVLDRYPSADRVPQAMYSLGQAYLKIDDVVTAREYFKILVARYPKAGEAGRAMTMLDSLRTDGGQ